MTASAALVQWCSGELGKLLGSDTSKDFTRYLLAIKDDEELQDYLSQILDSSNPSHIAFIADLLKRRNDRGPALPENFTVYRKSADPEEQAWKESTKHKGKSRSKEKKSVNQDTIDVTSLKSNLPQSTQPSQLLHNGITDSEHALALQQGARRKTKYVALYSQEGQARTAIHLPGRHICECQAHKHALVSNCLECGRVVCSQEGSGPCLFCGALVCNKEEQEILARRSKKSEKLRKKLMGEGMKPANGDAVLPKTAAKLNERIDKAIAHKDRLIEYDKTSVRRTKVVDDQSDYFSSDSNRWLSDKERSELKRCEEKLRDQRHGSRLNKKFTLDFAGRKIVEQEAEEMYDSKDEVVQRITFGDKQGGQRPREPDVTLLNPTIVREAPKFVSSTPSTPHPANKAASNAADTTTRPNPRIQDKELMEMSDEGHCLSMHQPWASLVVAGIKRHEGRTWYSPHRGRLWIAAAAKLPSQEEIDSTQAAYRHMYKGVEFPKHYPTGCLLGCVDMVDCLAQDEYREKYPKGESNSPFVFVVETPQELLMKFPIKGKHKIWRLDGQVHKAAKQGLRQVMQNS